MPAAPIAKHALWLKIILTPATSALSHSLLRRTWHAECNATSPLEHAVSTDSHAPCKPRANERRPAATEHVALLMAYTLLLREPDHKTSANSLAQIPTSTAVELPIKRAAPSDASCRAISAPRKKPPKRWRAQTSAGADAANWLAASQRVAGTAEIASPPARHSDRGRAVLLAPPGATALVPTMKAVPRPATGESVGTTDGPSCVAGIRNPASCLAVG
eukprot:scaffold1769_cov128-Isochrysis_galbana.AAC.2